MTKQDRIGATEATGTVAMGHAMMSDTQKRLRKVLYADIDKVLATRVAFFDKLVFAKTDEDLDDPRCRRFRAPLMADREFEGDEASVISPRESFTIEMARWLPGAFVTPHVHPTVEYLMVLEGVGQVVLNNEWDRPITLRPYDSMAIPAGALRSFGNPMEDRDCLMWIAVGDTHRNGLLPAEDFEFIRK